VVYSLTKYVGGHSDVIAGACLGKEDVIAPVRGMRTILGTISDPHSCWLLMRSLETLKLRMTGAMKNARYVAEYLADHPKVKEVQYLGFLGQGDPQFELYQRQCQSAGSTFSFEIHGGEAEAFRLLNKLQVVKLAVSLGGTETLMEHPATMTHSDIPPDRQAEMGITPAMVRISVGVEHPTDIIADLAQALEAV
jgi:methionine-gamma-lyase